MKTILAMAAVLGGAVALASGCGRQEPGPVVVDSVAYTPDGTLVALTNSGIFLFDEQLQHQTGRIDLQGLPEPREGRRYVFSLAADGTVVAVSYADPTSSTTPIVLYRIPSGEVLTAFQIPSLYKGYTAEMLVDLALSPHGELLAVTAAQALGIHLTMVDTATGAVLWTPADPDVRGPVWSRDGATLFGIGGPTQPMGGTVLEAYDGRAGLKWSQELPDSLGWIATTTDGTMLASQGAPWGCTGASCNRYPFWSATDGTALTEVTGMPDFTPAGTHHGGSCAASDDVCATRTTQVATGAVSGVWAYIYRSDGTVVASWALSATSASSLALAPDLQFLAASSATPGAIAVFRVSDGSIVGSHRFNPIPMNAP
jgi:WD40 repeat protein